MIDYTNDTVMNGGAVDSQNKIWRPVRRIVDVDTTIDTITNLQNKVKAVTKSVDTVSTAVASASSTATAVNQVTGVSATEGPFKTAAGQMMSLVGVSFTPTDPQFSGVQVWFTNYNGSVVPQLVAQGGSSPLQFLCPTTGETVTVTVTAYRADGTTADFATAPTTTVALDGVVSAPPAPGIAQTLVGTAQGYQFAFTQVALPVGTQDVIDGYRVYRNTVNNSATATLLSTYAHDSTAVGAIVVSDPATTGTTYFYWVSAVNTSKLESTLAAAQSGVTSTLTPFDGSGNLIFKNATAAYGAGGTFVTSAAPNIVASKTITTHGNPVLLIFSGSASYGSAGSTSQTWGGFYCDGVLITNSQMRIDVPSSNATYPATWASVDTGRSAASHTYTFAVTQFSGTQISLQNVSLVVIELG